MTNQNDDYRKSASHKSADSVGSLISTSSTLCDDDANEARTGAHKKHSLDGLAAQHRLSSPQTPVTVLSPLLVPADQKPLDFEPVKRKVATWKELPNKGQLALLTISRLAEPLTQTSLQSYMFYQLKSFNPSQTDDAISSQAGILSAAFTAAQFVTAIAWGRAADSELFGRKKVIIIGLLGTMLSAIGFGFSRTFYSAVFWRVIGGALNGNVGVMRTVCPKSREVDSITDDLVDDSRDHQRETLPITCIHAAADDIQHRCRYRADLRPVSHA